MTILILLPVQRSIDRYMENVQMQTIRSIEDAIQRTIRYKSISPSILLFLEVREVTVAGREGEKRENINISKVRVHYSLWKLLQGNIAEAIHEIRIINSTFSINQQDDQNLLKIIRDLGNQRTVAGGKNGTETLPADLLIIGENLYINYIDENQRVQMGKLFFEFRIDENEYNLKLKGDCEGVLDKPPSTENIALEEAAAKISVQAQYRKADKEISGRMNIGEFSSNLFSFRELTLETTSTPEKIMLRKIEDRSPYDFLVEYVPDDKAIYFNFASENFTPQNNIRPEDDLYPISAWLNSNVSGVMDIRYNLETRQINYAGDIDVRADNEFLPFPINISLDGNGNREYASFNILRVESENIEADFQGRIFIAEPFAVGELNIKRYALDENTVLKGKARVEGSRENFICTSEGITIGEIQTRDIRLTGGFAGDEADFQIVAEYGVRDALNREPNIKADGNIVFGSNSFLELSFSAQDIPLTQSILEFYNDNYGLIDRAGPLYVDTEAYFTSNFERFSFSLLPFSVENEKGETIASCRVNGNNNRLNLSDVSIRVNDYNASGDFEITRNSNNKYSFLTAMTINSVYYELLGSYYQGSTLILRGNHGIYLNIMFRDNFTAFSAQTKNMPLPLNPYRISELSMSGRGTHRDSENWNVQIPNCSITNVPGFPEDNRFEISGNIKPGDIRLYTMNYSDSISTVSGGVQATFSALNPFYGQIQLMLRDNSNKERYSITAIRDADFIEAQIDLRNAPLSRLQDLQIDGLLSGSAGISGTSANPKIDYSIKLEEGEYRQNAVQIESDGTFENDLLVLDYLHTEYNSNILQRAEGFLDLKAGIFQLKGQYRGIFAKKQSAAEVSLNGVISEYEPQLKLKTLSEADFSADLLLSDIQMFGKEHDDWNLSINRNDDTLSFLGGPENALEGSFTSDGSFNFMLSQPLPVRFTAEGNRSPDDFGISVRSISLDAKFLSLLGLRFIEFYNGSVSGDLQISGAPNDPSFDGELEVEDFSGKIEYVKGVIRPFDTRIVISDETATVQPVAVSVEGQRAVLQGGFSFDRWNLATIDVNVRTLSEEGLPVLFRDPVSGLSIDGFATGTFQYRLRPENSTIFGDLTTQNCIVTFEEKQPGILKNRANPLVVDLKISTGRRVEFLWPRKNFPIIQAFADTDQSLSIYFDNITDTFELKGTVELKSGEIYYFQRSFYLKDGSITFNENEDRFDPLLQAAAEIKEIDNSGSPVTISLIVDKEPLSSFTPRFESNPTLSTTEIAGILGTNLYSSFSQTEGEFASALLITGDLFSQFGIVRSFEQQMKNVLNLDLFSIRTQMIQNVILERVLNQNIAQDPESQASVGRYLDNTTLFLGKYLGNDLFLEALVQIQQDPITTGDFGQNELDFSMEVGLEWKLPFFLLDFSINPDFEDPMDSLQNTSLGLSWDFSY